MDLYQQILMHILEEKKDALSTPEIKAAMDRAVELKSYHTLVKIKQIIEDESLEDPECFQRIEAILTALENAGIFTSRHDL